MTFDPFESSVEDGQPIELYQFSVDATTYLYTSSENDIFVTGFGLHSAIPISRGKISASREKSDNILEIRLPASVAVAQNYVDSVPGSRVFVTIRRVHRADPDEQTVTIFVGAVQQAQFVDNRTVAVFKVSSVLIAEGRQAPRLTFQGLCNHMLYDARCQILENDPAFRFTFTVITVSGRTITVPGAGAVGADFFEGGFVTFDDDYRMVTTQAGDVLTLQTPFSVSPLGESVLVNAGCKHRLVEDCQDKFDNVENYGGFSFVPLKNPFGPAGI